MNEQISTDVPAIEFNQVSIQIKQKRILDNITLSIQPGEIAGILGPNGAGKSTMLQLVVGLRNISQGDLTILGENAKHSGNKLRKNIGVVLQDTALYEELTTYENLRFSASLYNVLHADERIHEVLQVLGITERTHDIVRTLSGGLRRRIAITRSLLHKPKLLIIDEPTLGVDVDTRHAIWEHLRYLQSLGTTVLISTNYLDEALAVCSKVSVLKSGTLLITDTPENLVSRAGSVIDVQYHGDQLENLLNQITHMREVVHVDKIYNGFSVFLTGKAKPENILQSILTITSVDGFQIRATDLSEIFKVLDATL